MLSISRYQYYLSWFFDQTLLQTQSTLHPNLKLILSNGRLRLEAEHAVYSFEDKYEVFFSPFQEMNFEQQRFRRVLVLGFGLGCVPLMLTQNFRQQQAQYIGVEIDPVIIDLAQQCLPEKVWQQCKVYQADALTFAPQHPQQYDLIAVDVFEDLTTPLPFRSSHFLEQLKEQLLPNGYLCYNTLAFDRATTNESLFFFNDVFSKTFPNAKLFPVVGNQLLVGQKI